MTHIERLQALGELASHARTKVSQDWDVRALTFVQAEAALLLAEIVAQAALVIAESIDAHD